MQIDYREEKILKDFPNAEICNLEIGDIVDGGLCIERKEISDFISSILDRRVFNQAINMNKNYPNHCIILVVGDLNRIQDKIFFSKKAWGKFNVNMNMIRGAVASLYMKYHVPVLFCSTKAHFLDIVNRLIEKNKEGDKDLVVFDTVMGKQKANPKLQVLLNVEGIGEVKAKKILEYYKEFSNLTKMERPKGISENDIKNILEVLK